MLSGARSRLLGAAHPRPARVCVVLQPSAASSQLARPNANSTAPGLLPAAADVTYVLGQYTRRLQWSSGGFFFGVGYEFFVGAFEVVDFAVAEMPDAGGDLVDYIVVVGDEEDGAVIALERDV